MVRDVRDQSLLNAARPRYFVSVASPEFTLVVRTSMPAGPVGAMVRQRLGTLGLGLKKPSVVLGEDIRAQSLQVVRTTSRALELVSILALALAALGLYGLVAFTIQRQTREIGVRLALGARPRDIYALASGSNGPPGARGSRGRNGRGICDRALCQLDPWRESAMWTFRSCS